MTDGKGDDSPYRSVASPYAVEHPSGLRLTHAEVAAGWVIETVDGFPLKSLRNERIRRILLDLPPNS